MDQIHWDSFLQWWQNMAKSRGSNTFALYITWYIAIVHFNFFSNSFVSLSSNFSVASLIDSCSFFISISNACKHKVYKCPTHDEDVGVRILKSTNRTVCMFFFTIPVYISLSPHWDLSCSFHILCRLFSPLRSTECQVWSKQTQEEGFPVE